MWTNFCRQTQVRQFSRRVPASHECYGKQVVIGCLFFTKQPLMLDNTAILLHWLDLYRATTKVSLVPWLYILLIFKAWMTAEQHQPTEA